MDKAEKEDYVEYFAFREIALSIGRSITLIALLLIFQLTSYSFTAGFLLISASLLIITYSARKV